MFKITVEPGSEELGDPRSNPAIIEQANNMARQLDSFIATCVHKVLSPESLALFVETGGNVPGLDLHMTVLSPARYRLQVFFRKKELGSAVAQMVLKEEDGGSTFSMQTIIERI